MDFPSISFQQEEKSWAKLAVRKNHQKNFLVSPVKFRSGGATTGEGIKNCGADIVKISKSETMRKHPAISPPRAEINRFS